MTFTLIFHFFLLTINQNSFNSTILCQDKSFHLEVKTLFRTKDTTRLVENFVDSLNIGRRKMNKVQIDRFETGDSGYLILRLWSKHNGKWKLKQQSKLEYYGPHLDVKMSDYNNDGLNDITYISSTAARGANENRQLWIYDKKNDQITFIQNSDDYPNLSYNKELNCIDAFLVYGGCSTVFLKLKGNKLIEFASVELYEGLTVRTYDRNGKEKILLRDSTSKAEFIRYKNFNPLKEADE